MTGTETLPGIGQEAHALAAELYPICRSITGDGLRATLRRLGEIIPLSLQEVPSGTPVLDWTVPNEWNIRDAYLANAAGERVVDFREHSLHVVNYSASVDTTLSLEALRPHLHTLPAQPDLIPYRTSYYQETWGFCLSQARLDALPDGDYHARIDATLAPGSLTYGECVLPGTSSEEILFSCHSCHPSLANDNLAGMAVATLLARTWADRPRRHTIRFLFIPGTIGSITWLARNEAVIPRIRHGLVLSCLGDPGAPTYKRSRRGTAIIDRAVEHVLTHHGGPWSAEDFTPYGYDERQYCSPGFDLAVGCLTRTPNGRYPEYHTSADNLELIRPEALADSFAIASKVIDVLEQDATYRNTNPKGEPQLGRRGLYRGTSGGQRLPGHELALLWVLNQSDGTHSLLQIAERSDMPFQTVRVAADALLHAELLAPGPPEGPS